LRRGDWPAARSELAASLSMAISLGRPSLKLAGVTCFAELLQAQGEPDCARGILGFAADHPSASGAQRAEIGAQLAHWAHAAKAEPSWPGLELDELVHRIVVESNVAHAPLIAALRGRPA